LNQAYVIATSTQVDVSKVDVAKIDDAFFVRKAAKKVAGKDGEGFFAKQEGKVRPHANILQACAPAPDICSVPCFQSMFAALHGRAVAADADSSDGAVRSTCPELLASAGTECSMAARCSGCWACRTADVHERRALPYDSRAIRGGSSGGDRVTVLCCGAQCLPPSTHCPSC
jgi:hypothetical protein